VRFRQGVQAEVLLSLALVMVTCTGLLAAVFLQISHARIDSLHGLLGRGLEAVARDPVVEVRPPEVGLWWRLDHDARVTGLNASAELIDADTLALAREAVQLGQSLVESGAPWTPIRFAAPRQRGGGVVVARIEAPVSGTVLLILLVADVTIFGLFGVTLLRRRVVGPLHRLATAVREVGECDLPARVPVDGVAEIEELGATFNEMQDALAARTGALQKAVHDLRAANASLVQAREGLDRAERLAMVGSLAAGVAHEVGNPMGALLAFLDVACRDEGIGPDGRRCLERATEQGERVRIILRQLLDFSRPPQIAHHPIHLESVARQVVELVSAQKDFADIEVEIDVEDGVGLAIGDASVTSQILLNLALNAAAAMDGSPVRKLRIEVASDVLRRRAEDGAGSQGTPTGRKDAVVCLVGDSGPGVLLDEPERIFDPFFTTKAPGQGTGLGLANARKLAGEMGGAVELVAAGSELGGALFRFSLPLQEGPEAAEDVVGRPLDASPGFRSP
jgi:signal transduction histidine kinase